MLSGRGGELDRVRGFERGADDYVAKPFSYGELRLRIAAVLRRTRERAVGAGGCASASWRSTRSAREVRLRGARVTLSQKEFALLRALAAEPTRVFTKEELLRDVWGFRAHGRDAHAGLARLPAAPASSARAGDRFVVNVWGVGYRLVDGSAARMPERGWRWRLGAAALAGLARRRSSPRDLRAARRLALVARARHELRGPLCAALLGLHGARDRRAAARRRGGRARAAARGAARSRTSRRRRRRARAARRPPSPVDVGALLAGAGEAWRALAAAHGARAASSTRAARRCAACAPTAAARPGVRRTCRERRRARRRRGRVRARALGDAVRVEVTDDGPGLPAPVDALVAAARAADRAARGHGLGVAAARRRAPRRAPRAPGRHRAARGWCSSCPPPRRPASTAVGRA